jgi:hypothetical protein
MGRAAPLRTFWKPCAGWRRRRGGPSRASVRRVTIMGKAPSGSFPAASLHACPDPVWSKASPSLCKRDGGTFLGKPGVVDDDASSKGCRQVLDKRQGWTPFRIPDSEMCEIPDSGIARRWQGHECQENRSCGDVNPMSANGAKMYGAPCG